MSAITDLLAAQLARGGQPAITWYGADSERIELSGAVLVNWVNKTTNLLVEEFDLGPGMAVLVDLPPHWRTPIWALATWRCGAGVVLPDQPEAPAAEVVVTVSPAPHLCAQVVAVSLPALARSFAGDLPAGAIDAAQAVMTYGDQLGPVPTQGAPLRLAGVTIEPAAPGRHLLVAHDTAACVRATTQALAGGGSIILVAETARHQAGDIARREGASAPAQPTG